MKTMQSPLEVTRVCHRLIVLYDHRVIHMYRVLNTIWICLVWEILVGYLYLDKIIPTDCGRPICTQCNILYCRTRAIYIDRRAECDKIYNTYSVKIIYYRYNRVGGHLSLIRNMKMLGLFQVDLPERIYILFRTPKWFDCNRKCIRLKLFFRSFWMFHLKMLGKVQKSITSI